MFLDEKQRGYARAYGETDDEIALYPRPPALNNFQVSLNITESTVVSTQ